MPIKNTTKTYSGNSFYHLYNRGVNKNKIFQDEQDCSVFLSYLKEYLLPKNEKELQAIIANPASGWREKDKALKLLRLNNFSDEITLICYKLMPNHFHFLIKQKSETAIDKFMNSLCARYTMYFNKKYKRVGPLYQSEYKAVLVGSDEQLLYLTAYIHRNGLNKNSASQGHALRSYLSQPSSLPEYLGQRKTEWVHPEEILAYFSKTNPHLSYQNFVEQTNDYSLVSKTLIDE